MNMKLLGIGLLTLAVVFVGLIVFLIRERAGQTTTGREVTPTPSTSSGQTQMEEPQMINGTKVEIVATEFRFSPVEIRGVKGGEIEIVFKNNGEMSHDLVFEEAGFKTKLLSPGQTETIKVKFNEIGFYTFYCSVPGHKEAGMEGVLIVE